VNMVFRIIKWPAIGVFFIFVAYGFWQSVTVAGFYFGPSEKTLAATGFVLEKARSGEMPGTFRFAPNFPFWSDGAEKERYLHIPSDSKIDNSDPDRWNFPRGTRIWKVFETDDKLVETRMLFKYDIQPWAWDMAVYQPALGTGQHTKLALARENVSGTDHDIPAPGECVTCHGDGRQRRPLGISAIQLPWNSEKTLSVEDLARNGLFEVPPGSPVEIPGSALTRSALGYLHANCGSCHHQNSTHVTEKVPLWLDLRTETLASVESTHAIRTAINQQPHLDGMGTTLYIKPGNPQESFLWRRMSVRDGGAWQMPPIATEVVDHAGVELIEKWILEMEGMQ